MVKALLAGGANARVKAKTGETALSQAKKFGYSYIQAALVGSGVKE